MESASDHGRMSRIVQMYQIMLYGCHAFHAGCQTLAQSSVQEPGSRRRLMFREFPIKPFGLPKLPNSTSHSAPGLPSHVTRGGSVRPEES